jgi:dTMP kinase
VKVPARHPHSVFVAIEGLDGAGKSEVSRRLAARLGSALEGRLLHTHEPNAAFCAGEFIRGALKLQHPASDQLLAYAYATNRLDHCERAIAPTLSQARSVVLTDRYYLSSLAYQTTPEMTMDQVMHLNRHAIRPDLFLFLDVPDEVCRQRIQRRNEPQELFDARLTETRAKYYNAMQYVRGRGDRVVSIDASPDPDTVFASVCQALAAHAPAWLAAALTG